MNAIGTDDGRPAVDLEVVATSDYAAWRDAQDANARRWLERAGFAAKAGQFAWLPDPAGHPARVVAGLGERASFESLGELPFRLPEGDYRLRPPPAAGDAHRLTLGWGLGGYQFTAYRQPKREPARLLVGTDQTLAVDEIAAVNLCRDLINTPTSAMLPEHMEAAGRELAAAHGAEVDVVTGDALLRRGFTTIHTVGRASASAPRLIDLRWGDPNQPKVTLVGKGVCFDSGGLNLKSAANMRLMKKDMGGAAHVFGLARAVMAGKLPVRLRVLVPAVENAVAGNAYRPGDVIRTYKGLTVEVGNTDAEGRLVLADALALAAEESPDLLVNFATLTGAARTALGTELPAMFASHDDVAEAVIRAGDTLEDPVWRLPLFAAYRRLIESRVADLLNCPTTPYGGAISAALFLQRFVGNGPWLHFDIMAWNVAARPARPIGGEAMGLRAVHGYLKARYRS